MAAQLQFMPKSPCGVSKGESMHRSCCKGLEISLKCCHFIVCFSLYAAHPVYHYTFGAYQAFRRKYTAHKGNQTDTILSIDKKDLDRPIQESISIWTTEERFEYKLVYKCESYQPHCVYVMTHSKTEAASRFQSDRFSKALENNICKSVCNDRLIPLSDVLPEYNELAIAFEECLEIYSSVIPTSLLSGVRKQLRMATCEFESRMAQQMDPEGLRAMLTSCHLQNLKLLEELANIECNYQIDITKEVQKNEICYKRTKAALNKLDIISKENIEHCEFSIFGKSLVDLYFYKDSGGIVKSAVIKMLEDCDDGAQGEDYGIVCGLAEFKVQKGIFKAHYAQIFADMSRVGSMLAVSALKRGKIIDKIVVYGLLLDYKNTMGLVIKYCVNFNTDESVFFVGEEVNAVKGFVAIVRAIKNAS